MAWREVNRPQCAWGTRALPSDNAIESLNMSLPKVTKNRAAFPTDQAAIKLLYLALMNISQKWTMPISNWNAALNQFTILFEERMNNH